MKPDWKDAPEWANWLAMDATGHWFWYEDRPILSPVDWMPGGKFSFAGSSTREWENTLSSR